ncbi:Cadmium/zinc-transporting ATPase HMA2 [Linum grandiflorum]
MEDQQEIITIDAVKKAKATQKSYFDVLGICCSSEIPLVENILKPLPGVKHVSVVVPTKTVIVVHDPLLVSPLQIVKALNGARLEANVRLDKGSGGGSFRKKWPSPYAVGSGVLLVLSFFKYIYPPMKWVAIGAVVVGVPPILLKAITSIRNKKFHVTILVLIAVISTLAMKDFTEAATIVFLFTIADWLESRASHKASAVMTSLLSIAPQRATIAETGEEVDVDEVKLNTVVVVKAGETVPIDGIVVDGQCEVDEKSLTGESFPVAKEKDSTVWAGTLNLNGYVTVRSTALAEDCAVAKMAKLVEDAQNSKSRTQRFVDRCAQYYTPAVILISASVAVVPLALRLHDKNHWFHLALVVLVSACPCALVLSTPVATFCALTKAASAGLLIKGGDYLETLGKIKVVAFDKTGTITRGEFVVSDFKSVCHDFTSDTLVYWVSSIESKSSHPMAAALVDYGRSRSIEPRPEDVEEYENIPGEGLHGKIDGRDIYIGNKRIAVRAGSETVDSSGRDGGTTIGYVYYGETLAGVFSLADSCRTGAKEAIRELRSMGIRTAMLTGDSQAAAMYAQTQLDNALDEVHSELLPEEKARIVAEFKKGSGKTAMVGDGINDAPALATADIGISMGVSGSALATETGNVILMSNDIRKVPQAIKLARRALRKVIENVLFSIVIKGSILALAFAGRPLIWAAVLADVGTCLLVILNSMLLLRWSHKQSVVCSRSISAAAIKGEADKSEEGKSCCESSGCCSVQNKAEEKADKAEKTESCCKSSASSKDRCCSDQKKAEKSEEAKCCKASASSKEGCCSDEKKTEKSAEAKSCCEPLPSSKKGCCSDENKPEEKADKSENTKSCCKSSASSKEGCCSDQNKAEKKADKSEEAKSSCELSASSKDGCCSDQNKAEKSEKTKSCCKPSASSKGSCCCTTKAEEVSESQTSEETGCCKPSASSEASCCAEKKPDKSEEATKCQTKSLGEPTCCSTLQQQPGKEPSKNCCSIKSCKPVSSCSVENREIDGGCCSKRECCSSNARLTEIVVVE